MLAIFVHLQKMFKGPKTEDDKINEDDEDEEDYKTD